MREEELDSSYILIERKGEGTGGGEEERPVGRVEETKSTHTVADGQNSSLDADGFLLENIGIEENSPVTPCCDRIVKSTVHDIADTDSSIIERKEELGRTKKRKYEREGRFINILTPKKDRSSVFLTPVKRTRRSVINGLKTGTVKVFDNSLEVRDNNTPYASLVECFRRLEKTEKNQRKDSIDRIVKKYSTD